MRYFKDSSDNVFAYEIDADEKYIKNGLVEISEDEAETLRVAQLRPRPDATKATKLKVVRYLRASGEWPAIRSAINSNDDIQEEWLLSTELNITDPSVQAMKQVQGWTDQQLQDLFNAVNA